MYQLLYTPRGVCVCGCALVSMLPDDNMWTQRSCVLLLVFRVFNFA